MAQNDYVEGFGVVDDTGLKINTISATRRAAIVNWLCTEAGVMPLKTSSDAAIEQMWTREAGDAMVVPVRCYANPQ